MTTRAITWERIGQAAWMASYSGTGPFEHWLCGKPIDVTADTQRPYEHPDWTDDPPAVEVVDTDTSDAAVGESYPPFAVLRWRGATIYTHYLVRRWNGSAYVLIGTHGEDGRGGYCRYEDEPVSKPTTRLYRVTGVDSQENESDPLPYSVLINGIPGTPAKTWSYNAGTGNLTVTAVI